MPGRRPLPSKLKLLRGNPGGRPLNTREPQPPALERVPRPPRYLGRRAAAEFRRVARQLVDSRVLTALDLAALGAYCSAFGQAAEVDERMKAENLVLHGERGCYLNPLLIAGNAARKLMRAWASELGLTPASRARVHSIPQAAADPFADFLSRGMR
jgi:P27 family predicted phage terminase small subunit